MAVTIQMIETKEFKTVAKGYDPEEVDVFLDDICDQFDEMENEIKSLRASLAKAQAAAAAAPAPAPVVAPAASRQEDSSEAAQRLLRNAQRVSDETIADARSEADKIVADAKVKADSMLQNAQTESARLQSSLDSCKVLCGNGTVTVDGTVKELTVTGTDNQVKVNGYVGQM